MLRTFNRSFDMLRTIYKAIIKTYEQDLIDANEELDLNKEINKKYLKRCLELEATCLELNNTCQELRLENEQQTIRFTSSYLNLSQNPS